MQPHAMKMLLLGAAVAAFAVGPVSAQTLTLATDAAGTTYNAVGSGMAKVITECQGRRLGETELERVLTELESLSEEEAQRLLAEVGGMEQVRD